MERIKKSGKVEHCETMKKDVGERAGRGLMCVSQKTKKKTRKDRFKMEQEREKIGEQEHKDLR